MRAVWKLLIGAAGLLLILITVVVIRTLTYRAEAETVRFDLPAPMPIDGDRAAVRLGEAIRFTTVSHQDAALDDLGQWTALHAWLETTYPLTHGALKRESVAGRTLLYTWPGSDPSLQPVLFMAHQDVVPVTAETETEWKQPPFSGAISGGYVWGRGAIDDKGSLVGLFEAAEGLLATGFRPRRTIIFLFGHDEEVRGSGAQAAAALLKARGVRAWFALDEGMVTVLDNPVTGGPAALIGVAEKGYGTVRLTAKSEGGHSSMPPAGNGNAAVALARAVTAVAERPMPADYAGPARSMMRRLAADAPWLTRMAVANEWLFGPMLQDQIGATPAGAALLRTTTAVTMLEGSPKENVLPQTATARINHRIHPHDTPEEVLAHDRAAIAGLPIEADWDSPPSPASPVSATDGEAWRVLAAVAGASADGAPVAPGLVLAATDSRHVAGVAQNVYRFQPVKLRLSELGMIHGTNERISVENLDRVAEFYARLMTAAAG